jgi:hypothetical protein
MTLILSGTNGLSDVDGDASTPAVRGTDANSGIFFGADTVGVSTGGSEKVSVGASAVVVNDGGADVDFRVESDTVENALFVDGATGNVGIGTSSPAQKLDVSGQLKVINGGDGFFINPNASDTRLSTSGTLPLTFRPNDTERMRIDSSGNVGIGNTGNSSRKVEITQESGQLAGVRVLSGGSGAYYQMFTGTANTKIGSSNNTNQIEFHNDSGEAMRITSGGYFKASNAGTYLNASGAYHELRGNATDIVVAVTNSSATTPNGIYNYFSGLTPNNTTQYFLRCEDTTNIKALIYSNGDFQSRTNSYTGISDVKLKQDIVDANSQWDDIKGLRVVKYRFKDEVAADPNYPLHLGVIAQEAELVSPGLVFESPDFEDVEVPVLDDDGNPVLDEDGNPQVTTERQATGTVTKGVKYSILYMKAVKALQEAIERIETLEAKVAALETGV